MDKNSKKNTSIGKNSAIEINPTLKEASNKKIVMSWGRMNPPTVGHEKLVNKVRDIALKTGASPAIYLSQTQDPKKNPIPYADKINLARLAFGSVVRRIPAKTIIDLMKNLDGQYLSVTLVVGSDRVNEFQSLLNKYNGKEYTFDSINVVSAGDRDPDSDAIEGISASKMREAASAGDKTSFARGLPTKLRQHADDIYDMVRAGMQIAEQIELEEAVLDYAARRKRALIMRKNERKMQMARERLKRRVATNEKLIRRSRKRAIEFLRKRFAGEKGVNYDELPVSEKILIDKMVEKRKGAIAKIAAKLLPSVRKAEFERVMSMNAHMKEDVNTSFEEFLNEGSNYYTGLSKSTAAKRKAHFSKHGAMDDDNPAAYKPAPGDARAETKPSKYTKQYHMMYSGDGTLKYDRRFRAFKHIVRQEQVELSSDEDLLNLIDEAWSLASELNTDIAEEKAMEGLKAKAEKSGIPYGTLKKVYDRGVAAWRTGHRPGTTPQQWGYARVNSFITGGKTRTTADADLARGLKEDRKSFKHHLGIGVPFKHQAKDALTHVDYDMDSDVDADDQKKLAPDETNAVPNMTAKFRKKYADEKKHTKRGIAFEQVDMTPVIPPMPDCSNEDDPEIKMNHIKRHIRGALERSRKTKQLRIYSEDNGAGDEGTKKVVKRYRKDTPGESVNEAFTAFLEEDGNVCALITREDIRELEKFADGLLDKFGIDIEFTKHFGERMSDERNAPCITIKELKEFFRKVYANQGTKIKANKGHEVVLKDLQRSLNMPVVVELDRNGEVDVRFKTIMRKRNFMSPNKTIGF